MALEQELSLTQLPQRHSFTAKPGLAMVPHYCLVLCTTDTLQALGISESHLENIWVTVALWKSSLMKDPVSQQYLGIH